MGLKNAVYKMAAILSRSRCFESIEYEHEFVMNIKSFISLHIRLRTVHYKQKWFSAFIIEKKAVNLVLFFSYNQISTLGIIHMHI